MLYHHGCPQRRQLMVGDGPRLARRAAAARDRTPADHGRAAIVDALERQIAPLDRELRSYARRQTGCHALIERLLRDR